MVGREKEDDVPPPVPTEDNPNTQKFGSGDNTGIPPAVEKEEPHAPLPEGESFNNKSMPQPVEKEEPTDTQNLPDSINTITGKLEIGKQKVQRQWGEDETPVVKLNGNAIYFGEGGLSLNFEKLFDSFSTVDF